MKFRRTERLIIFSLFALFSLGIIYLLSRPLIVFLNICAVFGESCKGITGILFNPVIYWLVVAGFVYCLARSIIAATRRSRFLKSFSPYQHDNKKLNGILEGLEVAGKSFIVFTGGNGKSVAFSTGVFRKKLYLSTDTMNELNELELKALVNHEFAHIYHNDTFYLSLARLARDLFFYLPGLHLIYRRLEATREFHADEMAARLSGSNDNVIDALLKVSHLRLSEGGALTAFSNGKTDVMARISKLQGKEVRMRWSRLLMIVTAVVILGTCLLASTMRVNADARCPMHMPERVIHACQ